MATREKKAFGRKPGSVVSSKAADNNGGESPDNEQKSLKAGPGRKPSLPKKLAEKLPAKRLNKKPSIAIKLKAKGRKPVSLTKQLNKNLLKNVKTAEEKAQILNNGVKDAKHRLKKNAAAKKDDQLEQSDVATEEKKQPKKRLTKKALKMNAEIEAKNNKIDCDDTQSNASDLTDVSNIEPFQSGPKKKIRRKNKTEPETLEEVMKDLTFLIKPEEVKKEPDSMSESGKSDTVRPKKRTKKQELKLLQKNIKKENVDENNLQKLDSSEQKVIDMLDLNVSNMKKLKSVQKRRHSIEKFPIGFVENRDSNSIFSQLPRSISPRSKRGARVRQSVDSVRKGSPYTRSDSPLRILRNGKQRKLKDTSLVAGLETDRKRKRLCSDLSELSTSKLSGYESDSSFSDMASLHGADVSDLKDEPLKINVTEQAAIIKQNETTNTAITGSNSCNNLTDTNSNLYNDASSLDINLNDKTQSKLKVVRSEKEIIDSIATSPSVKMPEKSFILDVMKQAFNSEPIVQANTNTNITSDNGLEPKQFYGCGVATIPQKNVVEPIENVVEPTENVVEPTENVVEPTENIQNDFLNVPELINDPIEEELTEENVNDVDENKLLEDENAMEIAEKGEIINESELLSEEIVDKTNVKEDTLKENIEEVAREAPMEIVEETPMEVEDKEVNKEEEEVLLSSEKSTSTEPFNGLSEHYIHNEEEKFKETELEETAEMKETETLEGTSELEESTELEQTSDLKETTELEQITELEETTESQETIQQEVDVRMETDVPEETIQSEAKPEEDSPPILESMDVKESNTNTEVPDLEQQSSSENNDMATEEPMPVLESNIEEDKENAYSTAIELVQENNLLNGDTSVQETPEDKALKENIFQALGLQSLQAAEMAKQKNENYTGTLKTVIKLKKKGRNSLKMTLQKNKGKIGDSEQGTSEDGYKIMKESASVSWKHGTNSSDTAGAHRKSHYSNRSNLDGSSEHTSDGEANSQEGTAKALVIPEKASSFSIHPERLCKDECSYCFGKFGLFDTPCHIAQIKNVDRQNKILAVEKHLNRDSCLCDACYRHVDRKSNTPSYTNKSFKRNSLVAPGPRQNHCHVLGCEKLSSNILRRKWIIKMRKSICQVINIDLDNPGLHSIPICDEHYSALEHLMVCAMCKRRLARNHIHYLGPEINDLNKALNDEDIPLILTDKPVVCKLCKCFASIILKDSEERQDNANSFFKEYKKRLLHFNDIVPMDEAAALEPIVVPSKAEKDLPKKKKKPGKMDTSNDSSTPPCNEEKDGDKSSQDQVTSVPSNSSNDQSRPESPADFNSVDVNTLIPAIAMECDSDSEYKKELNKEVVIRRIPRTESIKEAVEVSKNLKVKSDKQSDVAVHKLGANPSISVRQLFPGEEELPLNAHIDFPNVKEKTPEGWEKCTSIIQYDGDTKHLWHELQKPYGNQSSFLRHLILLEKYYRNGDLILSPNASHHATNYSESVQNRLRAYDNIPTNATSIQPISMIPFNKAQKSSSGIITSKKELVPSVTATNLNLPKSTPITLSQLNSPPLNNPMQSIKPKPSGPPPGLVSLHGTNLRPVAPLMKLPQSQKIKFPITKNWRPNLIPIDPSKKSEKKFGLVQVISGGKPFHITLEDYKKMCAIKRSFEMKQKQRQQESQNRLQENQKAIIVTHNSVLKSIVPRKGLIISKNVNTLVKEETSEGETILEKLDKQVEKLESKLADKSPMVLPKIPKSLTVIPQTVARKPSRPSSPVLIITQKNSSNKS